MKSETSLFELFAAAQKAAASQEMTVPEYLDLCKTTPLAYASAAERMVAAIGPCELVDTSTDPRLSIIHQNRTIKRYAAFSDFYGIESAIEKVVNYFTHAAQRLEESKQVLYLLGPVGSSKSSIAERLKTLMEVHPIYVLAYAGKDGTELSPVYESPLGLFEPLKYGDLIEGQYGINRRYLTGLLSPWAVKRLDASGGDINAFKVVRLQPSKLRQIGVTKVEPSDDNNADVTVLIGKSDMRKLEYFPQNDPDAYSFSGGLNHCTQGLMEFVEMLKSPLKVLHPLLTATQEGNYAASEAIGAIPFQGVILAHSNEAEWTTFKNNKNNEAFLDRMCIVKIPYCLQANEEELIYRKMLSVSTLRDAPCAPKTLSMLAEFAVLSRLAEHENSTLYSKLKVYNGESVKDSDPKAKSVQEYRDQAGVDEGMDGISTRFCFKVLSDTFNHDTEESAADPVHLMDVLTTRIVQEQFPAERQAKMLEFVKVDLAKKYLEYVGKEVRTAFLENADDYGQNIFSRYVEYSDAWLENSDFKDPMTGTMLDREALNKELEAIEKPAGIANPKDFRNEIVKFTMRTKSNNGGKAPDWKSFNKIREVIERKMFSTLDELLPVISFGAKKTAEEAKKHDGFVVRMAEMGYTQRQTQRVVEWYMRVQKSS